MAKNNDRRPRYDDPIFDIDQEVRPKTRLLSPSAQAMSNHYYENHFKAVPVIPEEDRLWQPAPPFQPQTRGQRYLCRAIDTKKIIFALGPQGSGKTYCAIAKAVEALETGRVKRIALLRPYVVAGEQMGFLPGDLDAKLDPFLKQQLENLEDFYSPSTIRKMRKAKQVIAEPLAMIRGRSFKDTALVLDEGQNATKKSLRVFLGRLGTGSFMVICGDVSKDGEEGEEGLKQSDLEPKLQGGLEYYSRKFLTAPFVSRIELEVADIVRSEEVKELVRLGL